MKKNNLQGHFIYSTDSSLMQPEVQPETDTLPPSSQKLKVKTETKHRAGKIVTLVEGFTGKIADAETLGKILKTKCGTGGSVKDNVIILQGDYKNKVIALLQQLQYKIS